MAININAKTSGVGGLETTADNSGNINIQSGGSTVMSVTSSGVAVTGSFSQNGAVYSTQPTFRNLIINGNMQIAQRGTSVSGLQNSPSYLVDRWSYRRTATWSTASFTYSQISSTGLAYFDNAARLAVTGTQTPSSDTYAAIVQNIEGLNIAHLDWGTSDAKTVTLSFWVRSSLTGTFSGSVYAGNTSASFVYEYTISSANTWEKKTITISGPTIGTFHSGTSTGLYCAFIIAGDTSGIYSTSTIGSWQSGYYIYSTNQTNLAGTNGATFDITGVQLEVGSTATDFENLPYDVSLARCQRYYYKNQSLSNSYGAFINGVMYSGTSMYGAYIFANTMREPPSLDFSSGSHFAVVAGGGGAVVSNITISGSAGNSARLIVATATSLTVGQGAFLQAQATQNAWIALDAEL